MCSALCHCNAATQYVSVAPKLSFQPYRKPAKVIKSVIFRKSSSTFQFGRPWLSDWSVQWGLSQPFGLALSDQAGPELKYRRKFCGLCLASSPLCKTEATKPCHRSLLSARKYSACTCRFHIHYLSSKRLYITVIFWFWASLLSSALCCAPFMPPGSCVCTLQGFSGSTSWAEDELFGSERAVQVIFQDYSWKQNLSQRRWVEKKDQKTLCSEFNNWDLGETDSKHKLSIFSLADLLHEIASGERGVLAFPKNEQGCGLVQWQRVKLLLLTSGVGLSSSTEYRSWQYCKLSW